MTTHDKPNDLRLDRRSAAALRLPGPEASESPPMPPNHGLGLDDREALRPSRPGAREHDPKRPIQRREPGAFRLTAQDRELLSQREVFGDQAHSRAERRPERADDRHEEGDHVGTLAQSLRIVSGESAPSVR